MSEDNKLTPEQILQLAKELHDKEVELQKKQPYSINIFECCHAKEPATSTFLRYLFAYKNSDGRHPYLDSFVERFLKPIGFSHEINKPIISVESEEDNMDVSIYEKDNERQYGIIFENKLKGADFQQNQLARYINSMHIKGIDYKNIYVVILLNANNPSKDIRQSAWRLPPDWYKPNGKRNCSKDNLACWCDISDNCDKCKRCDCKSCKDFLVVGEKWTSFENRLVFIHKELYDWLRDCINEVVIPSKEWKLMFAVLEFSDYLDSLYNKRGNIEHEKNLYEFLSEKLDGEFNIDGKNQDSNDLTISHTLKDMDKKVWIDKLEDRLYDLFMYKLEMAYNVKINYKDRCCQLTYNNEIFTIKHYQNSRSPDFYFCDVCNEVDKCIPEPVILAMKEVNNEVKQQTKNEVKQQTKNEVKQQTNNENKWHCSGQYELGTSLRIFAKCASQIMTNKDPDKSFDTLAKYISSVHSLAQRIVENGNFKYNNVPLSYLEAENFYYCELKDNLQIGISDGRNNPSNHGDPFWGIRGEKMPDDFIQALNNKGLSYLRDLKNGWLAWNITDDPVSDFEKLYNAAKEVPDSKPETQNNN